MLLQRMSTEKKILAKHANITMLIFDQCIAYSRSV